MEINLVEKTDIRLLLKVHGDILMENSKDFYNRIRELIDDSVSMKSLCFDFTKVQFMDSSGIGSLIKLTGDLKRQGCQVYMYNLNKNLKAVFQLSGISGIIKIKTPQEYLDDFPDLSK
jgi:anti-anti-sigma factor